MSDRIEPGKHHESKPRILIVDDEENIVQIIQDFFEDRPYIVETAEDGEAALGKLRERVYDLVLTDINLPGIDGLEVLAAAKESDPEVVVVIMTGYASIRNSIQALKRGAFDYITKPFDLFDIDNIVSRGLQSRSLVLENQRLVRDLQNANTELKRHEEILTEEVESATHQLQTLYDVSRDVNATLDVNETLNFIVAKSATLTGAKQGLLFRAEENTQSLVAQVGHGAAADLVGNAEARPNKGIHKEAIANLQPVRLFRENPADWGESYFEELGIQSLLIVPLVHKGKLVGLLDVMDKDGEFDESDEEILVAFASQAAMALTNAELFQHIRELDRLKSDFVAVVSHEVRTPLTSIQGSLELVMEHGEFGTQNKIRELISICQTNVERLRVLIGDILDFSKIERDRLPLDFESINVMDIVNQTVTAMSQIAGAREVALDLQVSPGLPLIQADRVRVGQVLTNLLDNAMKFSPAQSTISIEIEPYMDGGVHCVVVDQGPGIHAKDLGKLFQKFTQIDSSLTRRQGGLGLGLVISKTIVEGHGGRIWVESEPGKGSRFQFVLPSDPPRANGQSPIETAEAA